jgi:hypothetical protein
VQRRPLNVIQPSPLHASLGEVRDLLTLAGTKLREIPDGQPLDLGRLRHDLWQTIVLTTTAMSALEAWALLDRESQARLGPAPTPSRVLLEAERQGHVQARAALGRRQRCDAIRVDGKPCRAWALQGSTRCAAHGREADFVESRLDRALKADVEQARREALGYPYPPDDEDAPTT